MMSLVAYTSEDSDYVGSASQKLPGSGSQGRGRPETCRNPCIVSVCHESPGLLIRPTSPLAGIGSGSGSWGNAAGFLLSFQSNSLESSPHSWDAVPQMSTNLLLATGANWRGPWLDSLAFQGPTTWGTGRPRNKKSKKIVVLQQPRLRHIVLVLLAVVLHP